MQKSLWVLLTFFIVTSFSSLSFSAQMKEWTVMVFINGHNNLDEFGQMNIDQMAQVGSSSEVNIVAQWASLDFGDTRRVFVEKNKVNVIEQTPPVDMGDYKELIRFAKWVHQNYPAKKYMITVWNHGNGWHRIQSGPLKPQDISYDDLTGNTITTEQLGVAMREITQFTGSKVELYASDACLMAMAEVAAEMMGSVNYFAGSQELEPGEGWPYHEFLGPLVKNPMMNGGELGAILAKKYLEAYSGGIYGERDVTFSVFDMAKMPAYLSAMKSLTQEMLSLDESGLAAAAEAVANTFAFAADDYKDMTDYMMLVGKAQLLSKVGSYMRAKTDLVIANEVSPFYQRAKGVSVWMPTTQYEWETYSERYIGLEFHKATGWGDFLQLIAK